MPRRRKKGAGRLTASLSGFSLQQSYLIVLIQDGKQSNGADRTGIRAIYGVVKHQQVSSHLAPCHPIEVDGQGENHPPFLPLPTCRVNSLRLSDVDMVLRVVASFDLFVYSLYDFPDAVNLALVPLCFLLPPWFQPGDDHPRLGETLQQNRLTIVEIPGALE